MKKTLRFLVSGRVQQVGYREATRRKAQAWGLSGWVTNLADGRVEVVAQGEENLLGLLESWLWEGPGAAQVKEVMREEISRGEDLMDFEVRR